MTDCLRGGLSLHTHIGALEMVAIVFIITVATCLGIYNAICQYHYGYKKAKFFPTATRCIAGGAIGEPWVQMKLICRYRITSRIAPLLIANVD